MTAAVHFTLGKNNVIKYVYLQPDAEPSVTKAVL
jgi:hypothetical protein